MARRRNSTGLPLPVSLLQDFRNGLQSPVFEEFQGSNMYHSYADDPAGFTRQILKTSITEDVEAVMNSVRDNVITIAKSANATGKTHGAAHVATWFYMCHPGAQVYTAAAPPEDNLRRLLWGEIGSITERVPEVFADSQIKLNSMRINKGANQFMVGLSIPLTGTEKQREAKFSGKHAPYLLFIVDEGDAIPAEIYRAIESCMSGGHARLLIMYNPRSEAGYTYQLESSGSANVVTLTAFNHPNVTTGRNVIPGAVTRDTTLIRIHRWTRPMYQNEKKDSSCFEVPSYLVGATVSPDKGSFPPLEPGWRKVVEPEFSYMVLGAYPEVSENQLFNRSWIERAQSRWEDYVKINGEKGPSGYLPILGLDVADLGGDLSVATLRYDWFIPRPFCWAGVDPAVSAKEAGKIYKTYSCIGAWVDSNGVGASVPTLMRNEGCEAYRIMTSASATAECEQGQFDRVRDQGYWEFREWLRTHPMAMLPPDNELKEELLALHYFKTKTGKIKVTPKEAVKDRIRRSPDKADSIMMTFCPVPTKAGGELYVSSYI